MEILIQTVGWVGTVMVVLGYILISQGKISFSSKYYQMLNLIGGVGIGINVYYQKAWPALFLQVVLIFITIVSMVKTNQNKNILNLKNSQII